MNKIRQTKIKEYIENQNVATIKELQKLFPDVSLMTIHRDLDALERDGFVVKFRGGARSVRYAGDPEFNVRILENNAGKQIIARKALELIQPHTSIFLDASTTNLELAKIMPDININVFTTGPSIALELCRLANPSITMCCGKVNRKNMAVSGINTIEMLDKINIDMALVVVSGCSVEAGFTCGTESDMMVKNLVIRKARRSVLMFGKEKLSCLMPYTFASFNDIDYLISDEPFPPAFLQAALDANITVL